MPIAQGGASCANCWSARNCVVGLSVSDPLTVAQALVPELDAQSDLLIVLSQAFPFRNMLVTGVLTGAALQAALDHSAALDPADNPGGFLQVSGVRFLIQDGKAVGVTLDGQPLDPTADYRVAVPDFLAAGGDGYAMLTGLRDPVNTGQLISDLLVSAFRAQPQVEARVDGRISRP